MPGTTSSSGISDKYTASGNGAQHVFPEVATHINQPGLINTSEILKSTPTVSPPAHQQHQYQYQYQNGYMAPEVASAPPPSGRRNPWGLSPLTFGLLVATITALIVGGVVGGSVAGAMSSKNSDSDSNSKSGLTAPTATVTVTASADGSAASITSTSSTSIPSPSSLQNYVVDEPYFVQSLKYPDCNTDTQTITTRQYSRLFQLYCGVDMGNSRADDTNPDLTVADFVGLFAYTMTDCLYACSNMVKFASDWKLDGQYSCKGVTWQASMAQSNTTNFANCWLKNGTSVQKANQCNTCVSAKLST